MSLSERLQHLKPYATGAAVGIVTAAIVGFSADWIVMKGTMDQEVRAAKVAVLAQVCQETAGAHWKEQGNQTAALEGWRNEERTKLAEQFAPTFISNDYRGAVVESCDRLLRP